jgi:hypothetical protein
MNDIARDEGQLVVAHHHPGRLRLRSRRFEVDDAVREGTGRWLAEQPGVLDVRSDAATGSMLVAYDRLSVDAGQLLTSVAERAHLAVDEPPPLARILVEATRDLDKRVLESSGGRFGLGAAIPLAMGVGSVGSFVWSTHLRAPRWDNLLYWGVQLFRVLNEGHAHRRLANSP